MPSKNETASVSAEAQKEIKVYVVTTASYFDGLYYDVGEVIRTDKEPTQYMKETSEEELKNRIAEKRVKYRDDPFLKLEKQRQMMEIEKQKRTMVF